MDQRENCDLDACRDRTGLRGTVVQICPAIAKSNHSYRDQMDCFRALCLHVSDNSLKYTCFALSLDDAATIR
jgi:DNA polymerase III epsilon subunit-like protein